MQYYLIIDTETTGLPKGRNADILNIDKWNTCRLVQVAWELYDENRLLISQDVFIVKPDQYEIPDRVVQIHGITTEQASKEGIPREDVWVKFKDILVLKPTLIAHNFQFDSDVILSEFYRYDQHNLIDLWKSCMKVCTMLSATLPGQKWPKLIDLYERCFGEKPVWEMHRADNDVRACAEIYFHLN
jgi:DNA polymerase-3 subunit alpha